MTTRRFPGLVKDMVEKQRVALPAALPGCCARCGCTEDFACAGGCAWVVEPTATEPGVCSECATPEELAEAGLEFTI